jgi:hypothetical protein
VSGGGERASCWKVPTQAMPARPYGKDVKLKRERRESGW